MRPVEEFRRLHAEGCFLMPNPYDVGSARILAELGFSALATTSGGFATTLGKADMTVDRDALVATSGQSRRRWKCRSTSTRNGALPRIWTA